MSAISISQVKKEIGWRETNLKDDISKNVRWVAKNVNWNNNEIADQGTRGEVRIGDSVWAPSSLTGTWHVGMVVKVSGSNVLVQGDRKNFFFVEKCEVRVLRKGELSRSRVATDGRESERSSTWRTWLIVLMLSGLGFLLMAL